MSKGFAMPFVAENRYKCLAFFVLMQRAGKQLLFPDACCHQVLLKEPDLWLEHEPKTCDVCLSPDLCLLHHRPLVLHFSCPGSGSD